MYPIELKSIGFMIDERITAGFKADLHPSEENTQRVLDLDTAIDGRVAGRWHMINALVLKLERVLKECWDAQEIVTQIVIHDEYRWEERFDIHKLAVTGKVAQQTNAERNRLIREIDEILGESAHSTLRKTYA